MTRHAPRERATRTGELPKMTQPLASSGTNRWAKSPKPPKNWIKAISRRTTLTRTTGSTTDECACSDSIMALRSHKRTAWQHENAKSIIRKVLTIFPGPQPARTASPVMIIRPEQQSKQGNEMHLTKRANPASDVQHIWPAADPSQMRKSRCSLRCVMSYDPSNLMLSDPDQPSTTAATDARDGDRKLKRESVQTCGIFRVRILITVETSPFSSPLAQSASVNHHEAQGDTLSNIQHPIERKMLESLTFDFGCRATICSVIVCFDNSRKSK